MAAAVALYAGHARADLPAWLQTAVSASAVESALYRVMELPGVRALYPRPPGEARGELSSLVSGKPDAAELYALRARSEEAALDFAAAENDWKQFAAHASDKAGASMQLADFYERRVNPAGVIAALEAAAAVPATTSDSFLTADKQRAWAAYVRALTVAADAALDDNALAAIYAARVARYPAEPAARAEQFRWLVSKRRTTEANAAIDAYRAAFPNDTAFPLRAAALLAADGGGAEAQARALALYDKSYQPLWSPELVTSWFALLEATHGQRAMLADARARLAKNPDDLNAATRVYQYYAHSGRTDAAAGALVEFRLSKDARHATWSADELLTLATLLERTGQVEEAARYDYALATAQGSLTGTTQQPEEAALANVIGLLLKSPERPFDVGQGNLSIYRDVATLDQGPGYLNGILSLWLNSQSPASSFSEAESKATPFFHRAKAAELLAVLDAKFPQAANRAPLHAALIQAYADYGEDKAALAAGQKFLADFPQASERLSIRLMMADAYARAKNTTAEFALYDSTLAELAAQSQGMPLTAANAGKAAPSTPASSDTATDGTAAKAKAASATTLDAAFNTPAASAPAAAYKQVLERYLGRLTSTSQLPAALAVLRRELDRNPGDPLLYARLADFLQTNNLAAQQEEVYQRAIARFNDTGAYDKLARFYLKNKRQSEFTALSRKVVDIFAGTELEGYFANVDKTWPEAYLQLNLYAHKRFPHDLTFTRNLLAAYTTKGSADPVAWERLLREHWSDATDLQAQFFEFLSRTGKLDGELAGLQKLAPADDAKTNPAAAREIAEMHLWRSHFEQGAPLLNSLTELYPADETVGEQAASLFRSLAYEDPAQIAKAVGIEQRLASFDPANLDRLARIGDILADSTSAELNLPESAQLAQAAPYWLRMSAVHPGRADGYLQSATVFWDYFQFDAALAQIDSARKRFGQPAMYGYEAGAILEGKRDYGRAIAEYTRAAIGNNASARARLLELAARPAYASTVDQATAAAVNQDASVDALELRADVLTAQHAKGSIEPLVTAAIGKASDVDRAAELAEFSQKHSLTIAYRTALSREVELARDPVQRLELQYALAHSYEDAGDVAGASRIVEQVYRAGDNAKLLGVVRNTTDFYARTKQPARAITTLVGAATVARPVNASLADQFTLEAVAKCNESRDFAGARNLLAPLLKADPYNAQYLALQADSYALAGNDAAVRDLYAAALASIKNSDLSTDAKRDTTATARQGLIVALTHLKDYAGAVDQHIELVRAYPEDANILQAAAQYARRYGRQQQLIAFLEKAVADSPRDSRFAIDLARVDAIFENSAGALAAYSKAIGIRRDRVDLFQARADLLEHTQAFEAAAADYERLYTLTYKDPQWMEKAALARARQGRADLAVKALSIAWVDGRPPSSANNFRAAKQLMEWGLLAEARVFAERGKELAGGDLLAESTHADDAAVYARLLTRQHEAPAALLLLQRLGGGGSLTANSPSLIAKQAGTQGLASVTDAEWRKEHIAARKEQAATTFKAALLAMGETIAMYATPEDKQAYALLLDAARANKPARDVADIWIPAARAADLKDREAVWRRDVLLHGGKLAADQLDAFNTLEKERGNDAVRAAALDSYAATLQGDEQTPVLQMAAGAWRAAGDAAGEARDLRKLVINKQQTGDQERLLNLLLRHDGQGLVKLAAGQQELADAAANYAVEHGTEQLAMQVVNARAAANNVAWRNATTAVVGLYFRDTSPRIDSAFRAALAPDATVGERLATRADAEQQLVGAPWFTYAGRYGAFLALRPKNLDAAEEFLPDELEGAPYAAASYVTLAEEYAAAGKVDAALAEYAHAIELDPEDPHPYVAESDALWTAGRRDESIVAANTALAKLRDMIALRAVPESFWTEFASLARGAAARGTGAQLRAGMDAVLQPYIRKNGSYRSTELLRGVYQAGGGGSTAAKTDHVLALAANASDERSVLSALVDQTWIADNERGRIYARQLLLVQADAAKQPVAADGSENYQLSNLNDLRARYLRYLLRQGQVAEAQRVLDSVPAEQRKNEALQRVALTLAAKQGRLPQLMASYASDASAMPTVDTMRTTANELRVAGDAKSSLVLLQHIFDQVLADGSIAASDYLALAEVQLGTGDVPTALDTLRRMAAQPGDLYTNLDSATALLVKTNHSAAALPMLKQMADGTPWNAGYRLRLGEAQLAAKQNEAAAATLTVVAANKDAPYATREGAAAKLSGLPGAHSFGSVELTMLSASAGPVALNTGGPMPRYAVLGRLLVAKGLGASDRTAELRTALGVANTDQADAVRLAVFRAEFAANHWERALAAAEPLLGQFSPSLANSSEVELPDAVEGADTIVSSEAVPADSTTATAAPAAYPTVLADAGERRTFLLAVATVHERLEDPGGAAADLRAALSLQPSASDVKQRLFALQARQALAARNKGRRPTIGANLEQAVVVRPRLTAGSAEVKGEQP